MRWADLGIDDVMWDLLHSGKIREDPLRYARVLLASILVYGKVDYDSRRTVNDLILEVEHAAELEAAERALDDDRFDLALEAISRLEESMGNHREVVGLRAMIHFLKNIDGEGGDE